MDKRSSEKGLSEKMRPFWLMLACAQTDLCAGDAAGTDDPVSGSLLIEFNSELPTTDSGATERLHDIWLKSDLGLGVGLSDRFELFSTLVFEPVFTDQGRHQLFDNQGAFVEEAGVAYSQDGLRFLLGKFNPAFGLAWEDSTSIFGDDLADEYEITEQVGIAGEINARIGNSDHQLYAGVFTDDRSIFSDSVITRRGRNRAAVNRGSGVSQLKSRVLAISGEITAVADGLGYHLGYRKLAIPGTPGPDNRGAVAALHYENSLPGDFHSRVLVEWGEFKHFYEAHDRVRFITPSITLRKERLELGFSWSGKQVDGDGVGGGWLWQTNIRYQLHEHTFISVGWKRESDRWGDYHQIGLRLRSTLDF